jgi:hypothetical protein
VHTQECFGDDIGVPARSNPQLTGHISPRAPCIGMRTQH